MSKIIPKTLNEIIDLQPDLDDLSWREITHIVALEMGEVETVSSGPAGYAEKVGVTEYLTDNDKKWPAYHESVEHAMRVLESLHEWQIVNLEFDGERCITDFSIYEKGNTVLQLEYLDDLTLKQAITKAAAKCVINGIELNTTDSQ